MVRFSPVTAVLLPILLSSCAWMPVRDKGPLPPPNPPVFCYDTLGRAACYDTPQNGLGDLINVQLPPVIVVPMVQPTTTVVAPANTVIVAPMPVEEEPIVIRNPDPYPEPEDKAELFTDAPVPLAPLK